MNKSDIKNFSVWARNKLIEEIIYKAGILGITENGIAEELPASTDTLKFYDIGTYEPIKVEGAAIEQRKSLVSAIKTKAEDLKFKEAFEYIVEETAYTWFNRLIAIRFMEVNDYLPSGVRVLSSEMSGKNEPDMVSSPFETDMTFTDSEKKLMLNLKDDELFRFLFIKQCHKLGDILPELFDRTDCYKELLLTISFTDTDSVVYHLVHDILEDDFNINKIDENTGKPVGQVQIIGWLYQYYNIEPKDKVFAALKKNVKITKENIPAATQLFTPDWIVRYMVENSLGRLWADGHKDCDKSEWKYYLDEAEQEADVKAQLDEIRANYKNISPEDIKFLDPCMGSGHILIYAFDIFMQIYTSQGYTAKDAVAKIILKNLYGTDIDKRAYQLSYFALMMKARQYDRNFFTRYNEPLIPNLAHFQELSSVQNANVDGAVRELAEQFRDCDTYGSLTEMKEIKGLDEALDEFNGVFDMELDKTERMMRIYKILSQKYDVVVTNPPYMGGSGMSAKLSDFVKKYYPDSKSDLFAVFIERCGELAKKNGYYAMITQHAFMFLSSYEKLRAKLMHKTTINMAHLGARAFDEIGGEVVQTTAFVNCNSHINDYKGTYARLVDIAGENEKKELFLSGNNRHTAKQENFSKIPGSPVAYWVSENLYKIYAISKSLAHYVHGFQGMITGDNDYYLRLWHEIEENKISFKCKSNNLHDESFKSWLPYKKGGGLCRWYGNNFYVLRWENRGKGLTRARTENRNYYLLEGVTWSYLTSGVFSANYYPNGYLWDVHGSSIFDPNSNNLFYYLGMLNSTVGNYILNVTNPTLSYQVENILDVPMIISNDSKLTINNIVEQNITLSKTDWDSFETSWDFKRHPLLPIIKDDNTIYFCLKIAQTKWIKKLRDGQICFSPTHFYIEEAEQKGNDEQGDLYEGVFARLLSTDERITELKDRFGDDLEIIDDNGYVLLRRHSSKNIPIFCMYGIYNDDLHYIGEPQENPKKRGEYLAKVRIDISDKMYSSFLQDDDVCGFYASSGHFLEAIENMLHNENVEYNKCKVNYSLFEKEEFYIEPTDDYPELGYKFPKFSYQNEARIILNIHQQERWVKNYSPLSNKSANISNNELYMEATCKCQNNKSIYIASVFEKWQLECDKRFNSLKKNEEELNRIFIDIYGLQDELTPEVEDKDVTVRKADLQREIKSLISYAVGCMFGRYSLDVDGLAYAGGEWDESKYKTFIPDADNCIPITDEEYFDDDIVCRFVDFVKVVYGEDTLEENLDFIAEALGTKGNTSRQKIRNYFLNDFIKDHNKIYQKRPIYWLFDSGKQNSFKALVYMHRWNADTIGNVRVEYLHKIQRVYESEISRMQETIDNDTNSREITLAEKRKDKLTKQLKEARDYDTNLSHLALSRIDIDLDDGVKVNYEKVQTGQDGKKLEILTALK